MRRRSIAVLSLGGSAVFVFNPLLLFHQTDFGLEYVELPADQV